MAPPSGRPTQIPMPGSVTPQQQAALQEQTTPRSKPPTSSYPFTAGQPSLVEKRQPEGIEPPSRIEIPQPSSQLAREFAMSVGSSINPPRLAPAVRPSTTSDDDDVLPGGAPGRSARSTTVTKSLGAGVREASTRRSSSRQPPVRQDSETGYEGGVERHGQANDFVDDGTDDDSDSLEKTPPSTTTATFGQHYRNNSSPSTSKIAGNGSAPSSGANQKLPDLSESTRRNRNASASAHQHPSQLPVHARSLANKLKLDKSTFKKRTASVSSTRSTEANQHPFPTPGMKTDGPNATGETGEGLFDDWKSVEELRLDEDERKEKHWKRWGPYVSERQWATVREDYSANGDAWTHFPHEHARSRAYRCVSPLLDSPC